MQTMQPGQVMGQVMPPQQQVNPMVVNPQGQPNITGLQPQSQEKLDNISKVKTLVGPLRDSLAVSFLPLFAQYFCFGHRLTFY